MRTILASLFIVLLLSVFNVQAKIPAEVDSLQTVIEDLKAENGKYFKRVEELERDRVQLQRTVVQERKNAKYLFAAYTIIWVVLFGFVFYQFSRIKEMLNEIRLLKDLVKDRARNE